MWRTRLTEKRLINPEEVKKFKMSYYRSDYIYHHGILGQRWGKRNGPPYPLDSEDHSASEKKAGWKKSLEKGTSNSEHKLRQIREKTVQNYERNLLKEKPQKQSRKLTDEQKRKIRNVAIGAATVIGVGAAMYFAYKYHAMNNLSEDIRNSADIATMKETMFRSLDESTMVFDEGSVFHRMTAYSNIDYSNATHPIYTSWKKEDVATYATLLKDWSGTGKRYDVTLQALEEIRVPTKKKAVEIFEHLWNENPEYREQLKKTMVDKYSRGMSKMIAEHLAEKALADDPFKAAMYSIVLQQEDSKMLIDRYKSLGYNAIEDYFDKGELADMPIVIFDPSTSLRKTGERFVDKQFKIQILKDLLKSGTTSIGAGKEDIKDVLWAVKTGKL